MTDGQGAGANITAAVTPSTNIKFLTTINLDDER